MPSSGAPTPLKIDLPCASRCRVSPVPVGGGRHVVAATAPQPIPVTADGGMDQRGRRYSAAVFSVV
jgi:hypothetical protein